MFVVRKMSLGSGVRGDAKRNEGGRDLSNAIPAGRAQASQTFKKLRTRLLLPALAGLLAAATAYGFSGREVATTPAAPASDQRAPASDQEAPPPLNARPYAPDIRVGMGSDIRNIGAAAPSRGSAAARNSAALIAAYVSSIASTNRRV